MSDTEKNIDINENNINEPQIQSELYSIQQNLVDLIKNKVVMNLQDKGYNVENFQDVKTAIDVTKSDQKDEVEDLGKDLPEITSDTVNPEEVSDEDLISIDEYEETEEDKEEDTTIESIDFVKEPSTLESNLEKIRNTISNYSEGEIVKLNNKKIIKYNDTKGGNQQMENTKRNDQLQRVIKEAISIQKNKLKTSDSPKQEDKKLNEKENTEKQKKIVTEASEQKTVSDKKEEVKKDDKKVVEETKVEDKKNNKEPEKKVIKESEAISNFESKLESIMNEFSKLKESMIKEDKKETITESVDEACKEPVKKEAEDVEEKPPTIKETISDDVVDSISDKLKHGLEDVISNVAENLTSRIQDVISQELGIGSVEETPVQGEVEEEPELPELPVEEKEEKEEEEEKEKTPEEPELPEELPEIEEEAEKKVEKKVEKPKEDSEEDSEDKKEVIEETKNVKEADDDDEWEAPSEEDDEEWEKLTEAEKEKLLEESVIIKLFDFQPQVKKVQEKLDPDEEFMQKKDAKKEIRKQIPDIKEEKATEDVLRKFGLS